MLRKFTTIFLGALVLNFLWEEAHSVLYLSYQGGAITNVILFRAALFDAAAITLFAYPLFLWETHSDSRSRSLASTILFVGALTLFAILLEKWALTTGRWAYADAMPLIPYLNTGLTPTIQLGVLGYISVKIAGFFASQPRQFLFF